MSHVWPQRPPASERDPRGIALGEIDVAIALVRLGQARRVRLYGLIGAERAAGVGLARAQEAGVEFALERGTAPGLPVSLVIGPTIDG
jgi:hypothetical protein